MPIKKSKENASLFSLPQNSLRLCRKFSVRWFNGCTLGFLIKVADNEEGIKEVLKRRD